MTSDWKKAEHYRSLHLGRTRVTVTDRHQYAILTWADQALKMNESLVLVSLDYHPDTNPPFWMRSYQRAMALDPSREEELVSRFSQREMDKITACNVKTVEAVMDQMNNDEQINTAMALGYLADYHMINAMAAHTYPRGHHYLVPPKWVGTLRDEAFTEAGFTLDALPNKIILDVDLDYFMTPQGMTTEGVGSIFKELVARASIITVARSERYFNYLKKDEFSMAQCEEGCLTLLSEILTKK